MGRHGAVATNHPVATQVGLDTLRTGGHAADAAVAISFALGVCEPMMSGLGGDGFMHVFEARSGKSKVYNGTGPAPLAATKDKFPGGVPNSGPLSVSTPGLLGAVDAMHRDFGRVAWSALVSPASKLALQGVGATHTYCTFANEWPGVKDALAANPFASHTFLGHTVGSIIVQEDLSNTLDEIAADGAETFYRGKLAEKFCKELQAAGVPITQRDLAEFRAESVDAISIRYRDVEVLQTPPNSMGFTLLQILKIVEQFDLRSMSDAQRIHIFVEAKKLAFADRDKYASDPRTNDLPLDLLLSVARAADYAGRIDGGKTRAASLVGAAGTGDTTYFCVVDQDGNAVSGIQSNSGVFGSAVVAGRTGIVLNNRLSTFHLQSGHANELQPGKRVRHTMNSPILVKNGQLWALLGTPGADNQVQVNAQLISALVDFGCDPQTAVEYPRWSSNPVGQAGVASANSNLVIETSFGSEILTELKARGHELQPVDALGGPGSAEIIRIFENGLRVAGSDPRRDGWAAAY